jgi:hypothetical protein
MFYSQLILSKKGPLGKIWLAAHFEKKLTKAQIFSTDIANTCDWLLNPSEPLSLRVCGHLMLGIVKIYSRKVKYLMVDCTDAVWKIQLTFKPGKVDIDPQMPQVDDNKFFGNISGEMEYPVLENTAFASSLLPLRDRTISEGLLLPSQQQMVMGRSSRAPSYASEGDISAGSGGNIEFIRASDRRGSLLSSRASVTLEGRKPSSSLLLGHKFEDILPAFEEQGESSLFAETKFDFSLPLVSPINAIPFGEKEMAMGEQSFELPPIDFPFLPPIEEEMGVVVPKTKAAKVKPKKKKVSFMEKTLTIIKLFFL